MRPRSGAPPVQNCKLVNVIDRPIHVFVRICVALRTDLSVSGLFALEN